MPERWIAEAEQLTPSGAPAPCPASVRRGQSATSPSRPGSFDAMHRVPTDKQGNPTCCMTGPLTDSAILPARSFRGHSSVAHETSLLQQGRDGLHSDRILFHARRIRGTGPRTELPALMRAIASWGSRRSSWPAPTRALVTTCARRGRRTSPRAAGGSLPRPENDHWDPGPIRPGRSSPPQASPPQEDDMPSPLPTSTPSGTETIDGVPRRATACISPTGAHRRRPTRPLSWRPRSTPPGRRCRRDQDRHGDRRSHRHGRYLTVGT